MSMSTERILRYGLILSVILSVACFLISLPAKAAIPWMINYQVRLTDTCGKSVTGSYTFTFRMYDAATSGTKQWEEQQTIALVEADNGIFNVVLGAVTALGTVDFNSPLWLSVQVDTDS